jgi:hypothetical protein
MFQDIAQEIALILAGAAIGWISLFSFVVAPVAFKTFDTGRAERIVKMVIKGGHGALAFIAFLTGIAALFSGAVGGAVVAAIAAVFALCCQWALAPRDDRPIRGHRVLKTARIVASALTAAIIPVLLAAIFLTHAGI